MEVLIADDHSLFRQALHQVVLQLNSESIIHESHDWPSAIEMARLHTGIQLALIDLRMPGANDFQGLGQFIEQAPNVSIAVISATENVSDMQRALNVGVKGFISKDEPMEVFVSAIRLIQSGGIYIPPKMIQHFAPSNRDASSQKIGDLTPRQADVLKLVMLGKSNKEIASTLNLSEVTVKIHVSAILRFYKANNRNQLVRIAQQQH